MKGLGVYSMQILRPRGNMYFFFLLNRFSKVPSPISLRSVGIDVMDFNLQFSIKGIGAILRAVKCSARECNCFLESDLESS